jgi:spore germination protein KC
MRSDFFLIVAKGSTAADVLDVNTQQERLPANKLFNALDNSEKIWGPTTTVTLDELINNLVSNGKNPVLSGVYVYDRPENGSDFKNVQNVSPKTGLRIDALGVLKKDKLVGWLNAKESTGYNYIANNVSSTPVNVPCSGGRLTIETIRSKTKVNGKSGKGKPKISISVLSEGNIRRC